MLLRSPKSPLTFEDAMTIHVHRAQRCTYTELIRRFGNYPGVFAAILAGKLHNGSWEAAVDKLSRGDYWHSEIALMSDELGYLQLLTALKAARPKSKTPRPKFGSMIRCLKGWLSRGHALHADRSRS
jgi:hypothetical protein